MKKLKYKSELIRSMSYLAKNQKTIFIGQSVNFSGNAIYNTLSHLPKSKKIELPVFEEVQLGMSTGLAKPVDIPNCTSSKTGSSIFLLLGRCDNVL